MCSSKFIWYRVPCSRIQNLYTNALKILYILHITLLIISIFTIITNTILFIYLLNLTIHIKQLAKTMKTQGEQVDRMARSRLYHSRPANITSYTKELNTNIIIRDVHGNGNDWNPGHGSHGIPMGMGMMQNTVGTRMGIKAWEWE